MKILVLSAYDAASHEHWHKVLSGSFEEHQWTVLSLPARYFNWRIRSNGLTWSFNERQSLSQQYDLCLATSMVDLATLRGLVPSLCHIPTVLYFHENQAAYPYSQKGARQLEPLMVQLYSGLAADHICFNSEYNRESFLEGLRVTLKKFPDGVPKAVVASLEAKSSILPVPIDMPSALDCEQAKIVDGRVALVWNHRWEYDKGPERLLAFIEALPPSLPMIFHIIGQSFRQVPEAFASISELLTARHWLGEWGYIADTRRYHDILCESTYVLSTAEHDFQGLSVLEAVARGCIPLVPDRLAYREIFSEQHRYTSASEPKYEAKNMVDAFLQLFEVNSNTEMNLVPDVSPYSIQTLKRRYQALFDGLVESTPI